MDYLLDNQETEQQYQQLLRTIRLRQSGEVAEHMKQRGIDYKMNWGVSLLDLREIASVYQPNHLLALKLWNKQWRETMILATMLDEPEMVSEEQMDFWTKSFGNTEIAEQASANLWVKTRFAFIKALEWCRGKKHLVHYTGIHLMGRLAISDPKAIDEMFEPFFDEVPTLAKDARLYTPLYRALVAIGSRSTGLNKSCSTLANRLRESDFENVARLGKELHAELTADYFKEMIKNKD